MTPIAIRSLIARQYTDSIQHGDSDQSEELPAGRRWRDLSDSGAANDDVTENTICQPLTHCLLSLFLGRLLF